MTLAGRAQPVGGRAAAGSRALAEPRVNLGPRRTGVGAGVIVRLRLVEQGLLAGCRAGGFLQPPELFEDLAPFLRGKSRQFIGETLPRPPLAASPGLRARSTE